MIAIIIHVVGRLKEVGENIFEKVIASFLQNFIKVVNPHIQGAQCP